MKRTAARAVVPAGETGATGEVATSRGTRGMRFDDRHLNAKGAHSALPRQREHRVFSKRSACAELQHCAGAAAETSLRVRRDDFTCHRSPRS